MPAEPGALRAALAATWPPAETLRLGSWTLRRGAGGGNRDSAPRRSTARPPTRPRPRRRCAPGASAPLFLIRPDDAALDADLAARGYSVERSDRRSSRRAAAALAAEGGMSAIPCTAPLACMAEIWAAGGIGPARLEVMARAPEPRLYLLGRLGDRPAGCAFVAAHGGIAMLHALEVAPSARRQGLGARLIRAAAAWADRHGRARRSRWR